MVDSTTHKYLVTSGCLLWCASFVGEIYGAQPFSTIGTIIAPVITVTGIIYWLKYYRITRGYYPPFGRAIGDIMLRRNNFILNHLLEFWAFCMFFWMVFGLVFGLAFYNSAAFEVTRRYCQADPNILTKTGPIKYYGLMISGSISSNGRNGKADFSFVIVGAKGNVSVNARLLEKGGGWLVEQVTLP